MAPAKTPSELAHPHAPEPLPYVASADALADLLGRAQMLSLLEPRSTNGRPEHPAHQLMRTLEGLRGELPVADAGRGTVRDRLADLFTKMSKAGYFVFARIITHRQPLPGATQGILGVLTVAAAHPKQKVDGEMHW